jgi:SAM-dependent methyltransferase
MLARRLPPVVPMLGATVLRLAATPPGYLQYLRDRRAYARLPEAEPLRWRDSYPQVHDRLPSSPYDQHYFHQDVWAANRVADRRPARHVDVGSRVDYVGFLTSICDVEFVDIRPLDVEIERLKCVEGSLLALPYPDRSVESLSCLHVAEHVGLGRYGDPLDANGTRLAAAELQRVLAPGGQLLFSGPVGAPRVCFNAHRIQSPTAILRMFDELRLEEFAAVDDAGRFARAIDPAEFENAVYACGMFRLVRPSEGKP